MLAPGQPLRRVVRVAAAPLLIIRRGIHRWQRGQIYGPRPPGWWPERLEGWLGPRSPHDNRSIVIFVAGERYEFAPAFSDWCRGHVHYGSFRPDAADIAARLTRQGLPPEPARALAAISEFEGGYDSIQTWDRGKFSWGFIQFAATGGLPRLMEILKSQAPDTFESCFGPSGLDVVAGRLTLRTGNRVLVGRAVHNRLHDDPTLWKWFLQASRVETVRDAQVRAAYENYYAYPLGVTVPLGRREITLGELFAEHEFGRAAVCDRAVNRGVGHTRIVFRRAAHLSDARSPADAPAVLECMRRLEAPDAERIAALERKLLRPGA